MGDNLLFQQVGAFFVNEYYYHIYKRAVISRPDTSSTTKEYVNRIKMYAVNVMSNSSSYNRLITAIHEYCTKQPRFASLTFSNFITKFISPFIPEEYESSFNKNNQDELLCQIITKFIGAFTKYVTRPDILQRIVDTHDKNDKINCTMLHNETQNIIKNIQCQIYHKFTMAVTSTDETVSIDVLNQVREELTQCEDELNELKEEHSNLSVAYRDLEERNGKLEKLVKLLSRTKITVNKTSTVVNVPQQTPTPVDDIPLPLTEENIEKLHEELGDSVSEVGESQEILDLTQAMIQLG